MERAELTALTRETACAEEFGGAVFLQEPHGSPALRDALGAAAHTAIATAATAETADGWLCIRSGGTSGAVKFARHDERTLSAAVQGFCDHFELARVNAIDVLPAYHVSGFMARVRCAATGGTHLPWDWKRLEAGDRPEIGPGDWVLSLVPTQLHRLVASPPAVAWLRGCKLILVGGGPLWPELASAAARAELSLAPSYGMTETAAMVTALRPAEFLSGSRSSGLPLPHAEVGISDDGTVRVKGESLFRGYWPHWREECEFTTEDLGHVDGHGHLHVSGRRDAVIMTGGKKVQPAHVEAALRASGEFGDVAVIGLPDPEWGECVVACYPAGSSVPNRERAVAGLPAYQRPKQFVAVQPWPRNAQGKVDRAALKRIAATNAIG